MTHRAPLLALLERYRLRHPAEHATVQRIADFVRAHDDCLLRTCRSGHVTASAWILSSERSRFLLTHHRKLGRWLQLGGHVDGEPHVERAALREAREESGMECFAFALDSGALENVALENGAPLPLDVDVHAIPAHGGEPEHFHHDVRFLLLAEPDQALRISDESHALAWFPLAELESVATEESLARMGRKARAWCARGGSVRPA